MRSRTPPTVPRSVLLLLSLLLSSVAALPDVPARPTAQAVFAAEHGPADAAITPAPAAKAARPGFRRRSVSPTLVTLENYSYLGCYEDGAEPLAVTYEYDNGMTPELCRNICSLASCPAFGIGGSFECHCGKSLEPFAVSADEKECTRACAGDERDICGGGKRLNVYSATVGFEGLGGGNGSTGDSKDGSSSGSKSGSSGGSGDNNNNNANGDTKGGVTLSAGAIAGIAVGSAAVAAIISGVLACVFCFRKRNINNYTPPVMMAPTATGGYQPDTPQQQPMQQYGNLAPAQQQGPPQYGFVKSNENSPSYSTVSPASEAVGRSVSPLVAGGTALPPPGPPPGHSHEMAAAMAYEMPGSVHQK